MVRLLLIRLLETYFSHRWLYLLPIVLLSAVGAVLAFYEEPQYLSSSVIYIKDQTFARQTDTIEIDYDTPEFTDQSYSSILAEQLLNLVQTDSFLYIILEGLDFSQTVYADGELSEDEILDEIREGIFVESGGQSQMSVVIFNRDPIVTTHISEQIVEAYIQWKINERLGDSVNAIQVLDERIAEYSQDLEQVQNELETYLELNPEPANVADERPEIEEVQIGQMQKRILDAKVNYNTAVDQREQAELSYITADSTVRKSFLVVDEPYEAFLLTPGLLRLIINSVIRYAILGGLVSAGLIGLNAIFSRRLLLPLDVARSVGQPVLGTVSLGKPANERLFSQRRRFLPFRF